MRIVAALVLAGCLVQPIDTRVPRERIGPLSAGVHEVRADGALLVYRVAGHGPVCLARHESEAIPHYTIVYFGSGRVAPKKRYVVALRRHIGLQFPDCREVERDDDIDQDDA